MFRVQSWWLVLPLLALALPGCMRWRYSDRDLARVFNKRRLPLAIHHVRAAGADVRYVEVRSGEPGEPDKPNILFIHGAPSSLKVWAGYLTDPALAKVANLYALDRPGYGHSEFGHADTSLLHQAQVCESIMRRHPGRWIVFGSSYGGPIASVVTARNVDKVKALLLTSPAIAPGHEKTYDISYMIMKPAFGWMFPVIFKVASAEKLSHYNQLCSIEALYPQITQPVTYIHGGQDGLIYPVNATYAKAVFSNAHLKMITLPHRPHFFTFTEQGLITRELVALLDYARPPRSRLEEARREEAADSSRTGERLPFRPLPPQK